MSAVFPFKDHQKTMPEDDEPQSPFRKITHPKKRALLSAFAESGSLSAAAREAKITRRSHYVWLKDDKEYAACFEEARIMACDVWEDEARRRAIKGTLKPVFYLGKRVGSIREFSDTLTIFLMKSANPKRFGDKQELSVDLTKLSDEELAAIAEGRSRT